MITTTQVLDQAKQMDAVTFEEWMDKNNVGYEWLDVTLTDYNDGYYNILLDDGNYLKNTPIVVVRDYEQQVSLSYHYITNNAIM